MIIGLTGGIGSGKSTVADCFRSLNVEVINADEIARRLVDPNLVAQNESCFDAIVEHFGPEILQADGNLNRARLRNIIFDSLEERLFLEELLHPLIKLEIERRAAMIPKGKYLVAEIPLLFEANCQDMVDRILVIDCDEKQQIERVVARDNTGTDTVKAILKTQIPRATRLKAADDVINNDGSKEDLRNKIQSLHQYYKELVGLDKQSKN